MRIRTRPGWFLVVGLIVLASFAHGKLICVEAADASSAGGYKEGRDEDVKRNLLSVSAFDSYQNGDLLSAHFDFKPDPDDLVACALVKVIAEEESLTLWPVAGAFGWQTGRYLATRATAVMNAVYGVGNWKDAATDWSGAVSETATRWVQTLDAGRDVWVAEGGQHDFTADVVASVRSQRDELDKAARIHVVQHGIWNMQHTTDADLAYVKKHTDFIIIDNGNVGENQASSTADLNQNAPSIYNAFYAAATKHATYGDFFKTTFGLYDPIKYNKPHQIDGSDAVETLYIAGVKKSEVKDLTDFREKYLNGAGFEENSALRPPTGVMVIHVGR